MFPLILFSATLFASQIAASPAPGSSVVGIFSRQTPPTPPISPIPSQCQSQCKAVLDASTSCQSFDCLCTDTAGKSFVACGNCIVKMPGITPQLRASEQQALDSITSTCEKSGKPFSSPLKLDGSSSSSSGSSIGSTGSSGTSGSDEPSSSSGSSGSFSSPGSGSSSSLGSAGSSSSPGTSGTSGSPGASGSPGSPGASGSPGSPGASGSSGSPGSSGSSTRTSTPGSSGPKSSGSMMSPNSVLAVFGICGGLFTVVL